jgi:hypothetical protein
MSHEDISADRAGNRPVPRRGRVAGPASTSKKVDDGDRRGACSTPPATRAVWWRLNLSVVAKELLHERREIAC